MNKDITYAKDNVLLMKCGEFSRTGVYDGNEIWVCFGTETGHERYYRLYNEGCLYITSFNSADVGQNSLLISTCVDLPRISNGMLSKLITNFYLCRYSCTSLII